MSGMIGVGGYNDLRWWKKYISESSGSTSDSKDTEWWGMNEGIRRLSIQDDQSICLPERKRTAATMQGLRMSD